MRFQKANLPVSACYAEYIHFADLSETLTEDESAKLDQLLHYGPTLRSMILLVTVLL